MTPLETISEEINELIKNPTERATKAQLKIIRDHCTNPEDGVDLEHAAWANLVDGNRGTIRFGIANAMDVYRALTAKARGSGQND